MQEVQELDFRSQEQRQLDEVHKAEAKLRNTEVCGNVANHVFLKMGRLRLCAVCLWGAARNELHLK